MSHRRIDALDGLRTIAVGLVILFHLGFPGLGAGFIGVDVFFVLSGYLITAGLLRELEATGKVRLTAFWGARLRRLLPALAIVVAVVVAWSFVWAAPFVRPVQGADAWWSMLYVGNWHFIATSSYFAAGAAPRPLLHLWSLSVEEQFYLVWPLVLGIGALFVKRRRWLLVIGVAAVAGSISGWLLWTISHASIDRAYMGTDTKIVEPLIGAALAGLLSKVSLSKVATTVASWLGLSGLVVGVLTLSGPRPGYFAGGAIALSLAVAALIAGLHAGEGLLARVLSWAPIAYLGRISYGLYLWHWP